MNYVVPKQIIDDFLSHLKQIEKDVVDKVGFMNYRKGAEDVIAEIECCEQSGGVSIEKILGNIKDYFCDETICLFKQNGIKGCGGCQIKVILDYLNLEAKIIDCRSIIQEKVNDQCR